uniref:Uncharacterized protein n=1 Tax=Sipha flava TaxID=143950 RepID=A0A2S2R8A7_9HEMI
MYNKCSHRNEEIVTAARLYWFNIVSGVYTIKHRNDIHHFKLSTPRDRYTRFNFHLHLRPKRAIFRSHHPEHPRRYCSNNNNNIIIIHVYNILRRMVQFSTRATA